MPLVIENVDGAPFDCHWFGGIGLDSRVLELVSIEPNPEVGVPPPGGAQVIPFGPPQDQLWISYLRPFDFEGGMYVPDEDGRVSTTSSAAGRSRVVRMPPMRTTMAGSI